ncbi:putative ATP-binding protein involved in virulence [Mucilaginibacter sp. UYNi724]
MPAINWTSIYSKLAQLLQDYYIRNPENTATQLYDLCLNNPEFRSANRWIDNYGLKESRPAFDPITVFSSFNDRSSKSVTRIERINIYYQILTEQKEFMPFKDIDFAGCPTPLTVKIIGPRSFKEQEQIWMLLNQIMEKGRRGLDAPSYDQARKWRGINTASFTMFLFWIDYKDFLPLDTNTTSYLMAQQHIAHSVRDYYQYDALLSHTESLDHLEISKNAYEQKNSSSLQPESESPQVGPVSAESKQKPEPIKRIGEFRLVALKIYDLTDKSYRKVLHTDYFYQFSHAYNLLDENSIKYDKNRDVKIFNLGDLSVNVSAVVGKNGSGKSTISEILYMTINNLGFYHKDITTDLEELSDLYLDLYYSAEYLYRITFRGKTVKVFRYEPTENGFNNPRSLTLSEFKFDEFFYSVSINYAHFALNEVHLGSWISNMFYKNDAYQAPLVINPHRIRGNINVNAEESFANSRLLANILINVDPLKEKEKVASLRKLTENRSADYLQLKFNSSKLKTLYSVDAPTKLKPDNKRNYGFENADDYWKDFVTIAADVFEIKLGDVSPTAYAVTSFQDNAFKYILRKVISISMTYDHYHEWFNSKKNTFKDIRHFLELLRDDYSHITYKLWQAVNFLKYDYLRERIKSLTYLTITKIPVDDLARAIDQTIKDQADPLMQVIHFIPPSFMRTEVYLEGDIALSQLSSGEKQKIFAASTIAYHLLNLNSKISEDELIPYRFILVVFDEVELYFHPEMQRGFIDYLLTYFSYLPLDQLTGLQMTFITHSPFILSDIPADNILFMGGDRSGWQTFGANIHDLLADSFFLENGFMGEHVKKTIQSLVAFLTDQKPTNNMLWDKPKAWQLINIVGEPLIKERLLSLFQAKFNLDITRQQRIKKLKEELKQLERNA